MDESKLKIPLVVDEGIMLEKTDLSFENKAVLNPAAYFQNGTLKMFYRAVKEGNLSTIGYAEFKDNKLVRRNTEPVLFPEFPYESKGLEDPRIVYFENLYYLFYTAYDGINARGAMATSTDLVNFKKEGLITPTITYAESINLFKTSGVSAAYETYAQHYVDAISPNVMLWAKDNFIFPRRINGKIAFLYRIMPGIQIAYVDSLEELKSDQFWINHLKDLKNNILLDPVYNFEARKVGGGFPPIETPDGWLFIYHAVELTPKGYVYSAGAALLDLNNPQKVTGRLKEPLFRPSLPWELKGQETNIVFPTAAYVDENNKLQMFMGDADTCISRKSVDLKELIYALKNSQ